MRTFDEYGMFTNNKVVNMVTDFFYVYLIHCIVFGQPFHLDTAVCHQIMLIWQLF